MKKKNIHLLLIIVITTVSTFTMSCNIIHLNESEFSDDKSKNGINTSALLADESNDTNTQSGSEYISPKVSAKDCENANNQNNTFFNSISFFEDDNTLFYLGNDGYYKTDKINDSKKISDNYLSYCLKTDDWIYGVKCVHIQSAEADPDSNEHDSLIRVSVDGTKEEVLLERCNEEIYYTSDYIFYSVFSGNNIKISRCDYSGGNIKDITTNKIFCWMVTNDFVIFVEQSENWDIPDKMFSVDLEGNNKTLISEISKTTDDLPDYSGTICNILSKDNEIFYRQIFTDELLQNPITRLYKKALNSDNKLIFSNEGVNNYVFAEEGIIISNSDNIKYYSFDESSEMLLYTSPTDSFLSSVFYNNNNIYFCQYKTDSMSIMQYDLNSHNFITVVKELPLTGMIETFVEIFWI